MSKNDLTLMTKDVLALDPVKEVEKITSFIQDQFQILNRKTAVIGLSGGLDSSLAASLALISLGQDRVICCYLPERDSKRIHRQHALMLSEKLDLDLHFYNISQALSAMGVYQLLPLRFIPGRKLKENAVHFGKKRFLNHSQRKALTARLSARGGPWVARTNAYISAKHRLRMVALYKTAERVRGLVIGAANKTEWMTGTFTQWGCDHCADIMPLIHLYRSQLVILAEHLDIPQEILQKKADPDLLPGLDDKGALLGSFENTDLILWGIENGISAADLESKFGSDQVRYIIDLIKNSDHYREAPYSLI
jgi:NAD+ synthase